MAARDTFGRDALHYAALRNDVEAALRLLSEGADPSAADKAGLTPLHFAAQAYSLEVARLPVQAGANVSAEDRYGNTPLGRAVFESEGRGELIALLLEHGADPRKPNKTGQTPLGLARLVANYDVAQFFADLDEPDRT